MPLAGFQNMLAPAALVSVFGENGVAGGGWSALSSNSAAALLLPLAAVALDVLIGDPPSWPHPVRFIGLWLRVSEKKLRRLSNERLAGALGVLAALLLTGSVVTGLLLLPGLFHVLAVLYLSFSGLALGQLLREGSRAAGLLESGALVDARIAVGHLVSRDVSAADEGELYRALAESLSENFTDGFFAPFFWLSLGGPLGLWLYKTASTIDSCWGYPYEPWTRFGTAGALLDDALAYVPARLSGLLLPLGAWLMGMRWMFPGREILQRQIRSMKSPNAGWSMTLCAWIHQAHMGGPAVYAGKLVEKPLLGPVCGVWTAEKIRRLLKHLLVTAGLAVGCFALLRLAVIVMCA